MSTPSRKKSWQPARERVRLQAALAIQRENVMQRLVRLRENIGHPEKPGEPLPQDQAAAQAGVTARQWQRWESGASVPYARNLSAVADAFGFDVAEFYDGPAGQQAAVTPDLSNPMGELTGILAKINARLDDQDKVLREIKAEQVELRELMAEQRSLNNGTEELRRLAREIVTGRPTSAPSPEPAQERP